MLKEQKLFLENSIAGENELEQTATKLSGDLPKGAVIILSGPLGAGKTVFVRGLAKGLHSNAQVTSPTYTIINQYPTPEGPLVHIDAYQLADIKRIWALGLSEMLGSARLIAIEWGEALLDELEVTALVQIDIEKNGRRVNISLPIAHS